MLRLLCTSSVVVVCSCNSQQFSGRTVTGTVKKQSAATGSVSTSSSGDATVAQGSTAPGSGTGSAQTTENSTNSPPQTQPAGTQNQPSVTNSAATSTQGSGIIGCEDAYGTCGAKASVSGVLWTFKGIPAGAQNCMFFPRDAKLTAETTERTNTFHEDERASPMDCGEANSTQVTLKGMVNTQIFAKTKIWLRGSTCYQFEETRYMWAALTPAGLQIDGQTVKMDAYGPSSVWRGSYTVSTNTSGWHDANINIPDWIDDQHDIDITLRYKTCDDNGAFRDFSPENLGTDQ